MCNGCVLKQNAHLVKRSRLLEINFLARLAAMKRPVRVCPMDEA